MSAVLTVHSESRVIRAVLSTASGQLVESVIKNRLSRGESTPLKITWKNGSEADYVDIGNIDGYVMDFAQDGDPSISSQDLAKNLAEADRVIAIQGYLGIDG